MSVDCVCMCFFFLVLFFSSRERRQHDKRARSSLSSHSSDGKDSGRARGLSILSSSSSANSASSKGHGEETTVSSSSPESITTRPSKSSSVVIVDAADSKKPEASNNLANMFEKITEGYDRSRKSISQQPNMDELRQADADSLDDSAQSTVDKRKSKERKEKKEKRKERDKEKNKEKEENEMKAEDTKYCAEQRGAEESEKKELKRRLSAQRLRDAMVQKGSSTALVQRILTHAPAPTGGASVTRSTSAILKPSTSESKVRVVSLAFYCPHKTSQAHCMCS